MRLDLPALLLTLTLTLSMTPATADEAARQIEVTGSAAVETVPDRATITAGVQTQAPTAGQALTDNAAAMAAVFAALDTAGIARADIQTSQLSLDPLWDNRGGDAPDTPRVTGYQAGNLITIRVREVSRLGAVVDALGGAGANRIDGISFDVADPRPHLDAARVQAVADARAKAELLAKAAGVTLGPVQSIREQGPARPSPVFARMEAAAATPVAEGTVSIEATVEVVFGIE